MSDAIRFYLDEHVAHAVAAGLRRRGVDVLTVVEASILSATDEEHLELARQQQRVIFTQDDDFLRLHARGLPHSGIVYAPQQTPIGQILAGLMLIHDVLTPVEMNRQVEFL